MCVSHLQQQEKSAIVDLLSWSKMAATARIAMSENIDRDKRHQRKTRLLFRENIINGVSKRNKMMRKISELAEIFSGLYSRYIATAAKRKARTSRFEFRVPTKRTVYTISFPTQGVKAVRSVLFLPIEEFDNPLCLIHIQKLRNRTRWVIRRLLQSRQHHEGGVLVTYSAVMGFLYFYLQYNQRTTMFNASSFDAKQTTGGV